MRERLVWMLALVLLGGSPAFAAVDPEDENETVAPYQGEDEPRPAPQGTVPPGLSDSGSESRAPKSRAKESDKPAPGPVQVYRVVDEDGNVSFTDEPPEGSVAEEITIRPTNTMPGGKVSRDGPLLREGMDEDGGQNAPAGYQINITSPEAEKTYQNPQQPIGVSYSIQPALAEDHNLKLVLDGSPQSGLSLPADLPRGEHRIRVAVFDRRGKEVSSSDVRLIYVQRPSKLLPAR